jgi:hypothetical protein
VVLRPRPTLPPRDLSAADGRRRARQGRLGETERGWDGGGGCVVWARWCGIEGMRRSTRVSKSW